MQTMSVPKTYSSGISYLKHRDRPGKHRPVVVADAGESLNTPQCTQAESAFLAAYTIASLVYVVAEYQVLKT